MSYDYLEAKRRNDFLEEVNKNLVIECEALKSGQGWSNRPWQGCSVWAYRTELTSTFLKQTKSAFGQIQRAEKEANLVMAIRILLNNLVS